jgi:hypothetical protein
VDRSAERNGEIEERDKNTAGWKTSMKHNTERDYRRKNLK